MNSELEPYSSRGLNNSSKRDLRFCQSPIEFFFVMALEVQDFYGLGLGAPKIPVHVDVSLV